jgi:predicted RNase H-like HicB family nuclease
MAHMFIYIREKPSRGQFVGDRQIVIRKDEGGYFIASCPSLKGCHSYGNTIEEALDNIKECIQLCEDELKEGGRI